jgi:type I restriction enzyme S subunit
MSEVAQATHSSPDGHIPQLRFPGFSGVWRENRLGNIARIFDGTHQTPKYVENGIPFYSVEHITANQFDDTKYISEEVFERENMRVKLEREDILMTRIGNIGMAKYIDWNVNASFYVSLALIKKNESFNSKFLSQLIHSPNFQRQLWKRTIHVAFPQKINLGEIGKCESILPTKPEQQKIAAFLTTVDNKIEQLSKKQELLGEYKKGLMQQIFSQAIRFKADDGSDFPDWEEKKLGSLCEITTGKLDANAMVKDGQYRFYTCAKEYYKIDDYAFDTDALIVSGNGANVGYIHHYQGKFNAYQRTYVLDSFTDNIVFVKFVLDGYLHKRIMKEKNEGNTPYIVMGTLTDMKINLPSFSEQTKISNFLSSIDNKIEQVGKQLDESKQFKKALLQQMFV